MLKTLTGDKSLLHSFKGLNYDAAGRNFTLLFFKHFSFLSLLRDSTGKYITARLHCDFRHSVTKVHNSERNAVKSLVLSPSLVLNETPPKANFDPPQKLAHKTVWMFSLLNSQQSMNALI